MKLMIDQAFDAARKERKRVKRLQKYIEELEGDLSYAGTPMGFTGNEWSEKRDKHRARLEKLGDLPSEISCQDTGKMKRTLTNGKKATGHRKGKSVSRPSSKEATSVGRP